MPTGRAASRLCLAYWWYVWQLLRIEWGCRLVDSYKNNGVKCMNINLVANIAGVAGVLICAVAVAFRLVNHYHIAGFEVLTLFNCGSVLVVLGCFLKLEAIWRRTGSQ